LIEAEMVQDQRKWQLDWVRRITAEIQSGELEWTAGISEKDKSSDQAEIPNWLKDMQEEAP
jgi:hypothetical protein